MDKLYLLTDQLKDHPEYEFLTIKPGELVYAGVSIDFNGFDVEKFINDSEYFLSQMSTLPMKDVFKIIKLHVDYANLLKKIREESAKKVLDDMMAVNPPLANFQIFKNRVNGTVKSFLKYKDKNGVNYIYENVSEEDFLDTIKGLQESNAAVTEDVLFSNIASKYTNIKLEDITTAEKRMGVSEKHLNTLKRFEQESRNEMDNHRKVLGNEENGIYLNGDEVITTHLNKLGESVTETHKNNIESEEDLGKDVIVSYQAEQLISFEEYNDIITKSESLSDEDLRKVQNMENFLFEVITYKEYLTPELLDVCDKYYQYWNYLSAIEEPSQVIYDTVNRYSDMEARSQERQAVNAREKVASLQRIKDNSKDYGFINALLYVLAVLFVGVVVGVITILAK